MVCLFLTLILACVTSLQACPDPITIHYEHYEGPVILHTANGGSQQQRCHDNQEQRYHDNQQLDYQDNQQHHCHDNQQLGCHDKQQNRCQDNQQQHYPDKQQLVYQENQQYGYYGNQHKQHGCCETECTCVSKQSYQPYVYGSVPTNVGCGCPVADTIPMVYCVCNTYGGNGLYPDYSGGNQGYQGYQKYQGKCSGCKKQ